MRRRGIPALTLAIVTFTPTARSQPVTKQDADEQSQYAFDIDRLHDSCADIAELRRIGGTMRRMRSTNRVTLRRDGRRPFGRINHGP